VFKRNGGWAFRLDAGFQPGTDRRRQISRQGFATRKAAEAALNEAVQKSAQGTIVSRSSTRLRDYLDDWLMTQQSRLRETTHHSYVFAVQRVERRLGAVALQSLTPLQIEQFYAELLSAGLSAKTVRNTHVVLRKALADAERLGLVPRNAAAAAKAPTARRPEFTTWSSDDVKQFFAAVHDDRLYALFVLLATTGLRRGEALGLRWRDVDFDAGQLAVVQTLTTVGSETLISQPKSQRSRRTVYLDSETISVLKEHRRRQREDQLAVGAGWDRVSDLVFRDELGGSIHPDWLSREFRRLVAVAGAPCIRLHDLRHTHATLALKAGVHPKVVSERLGHSSIAITLDLYSHVTPGIAREAADAVAAKIFH
jgi:integrase